LLGNVYPSARELSFAASRAELQHCRACGAVTRFPRYNDVQKVLRTRTGHATPLAVELDRTRLDGSLGTIAGDDTIFMATRSPAIARSIARRLEGMLHGDRARRPARR
jgi:arginine repressor